MEWLVDGEPLRWKIMVMTQAGVYFVGKDALVARPADAVWFSSYALAADRSKEVVLSNLDGVTQIRLISSAFQP